MRNLKDILYKVALDSVIGSSDVVISKIAFDSRLVENGDVFLALKAKTDGCHMGQLDGSIKTSKKKLRNKILGVTCHNSRTLAKNAIKNKASYLAFGSFLK